MTDGTGAEPFVEPMPEPIMGTVAETPALEPLSVPAAEPIPADATTSVARPTDVVIVTVLALIAALGDVIAGTAWLIEKDSAPTPAAYLAWSVLLIGLGTAALAIILFQGSRIARTVIALFMILRIAAHIWVWISVGSDAAVTAMIEILIALVVLILLFSRESTAFLTGMKR